MKILDHLPAASAPRLCKFSSFLWTRTLPEEKANIIYHCAGERTSSFRPLMMRSFGGDKKFSGRAGNLFFERSPRDLFCNIIKRYAPGGKTIFSAKRYIRAGSDCDEWQNRRNSALNCFSKHWKTAQKWMRKSSKKKTWKMRRKRFVFLFQLKTMKTSIIFLLGLFFFSWSFSANRSWSIHWQMIERERDRERERCFHMLVLHQPILWHLWFSSFWKSL